MKRFKKVYIEITNVCNLSCKFCPKTKRKSGFMSLKDFEYILGQIKPFTDYIYLHLLGEPLLHPQLEAFLSASFKKGLKANITTNGTLIKDKGEILLSSEALRQVNFSLHSFDANSKVSSMEDYITSILDFVNSARLNTGIMSSLRLWNLKSDSISEEENTSNNIIIGLIEEKLQLQYNIMDKLRDNPGIKLAEQVYLNMAQRFDWPDLNLEEKMDKGFCYGLRDQIGILVDGTVIPCCLDSEGTLDLGNIFETSFDKIITGPRAEAIYTGFSRREAVEELCKKCGYRSRFGK